MDITRPNNELCSCGHLKEAHDNSGITMGHGKCLACKCRKFTWVKFIDDRE